LVHPRRGGAMAVRLYVEDQSGELDAVETATEDDFMFFRDSVHLALEGEKLASRFPMLFKTFFSDWQSGDVPGLERELREIYSAFGKLPPDPPDGNWRARLRQSGRTPKTLADVYVDKNGAPLLERLIALVQTAREKGLPVRWGESASQPLAGPRILTTSVPQVRNAQDEALLAAVEAGDQQAARDALTRGASANATVVDEDDNACSSRAPALYMACTRGDAAMVELLLSNGADPDGAFRRRGIIDFETRTCLIAAFSHLDIVSMLLRAGADPNLASTWGEDRTTETSPLAQAKDNPKLEELLRGYGAK
jgi:hypothetical protein